METAKIKKRIKEEIQKTQLKIADLKEFTAPISPDNAIGRVSRMDAINNKSVNDAALRNLEKKLEALSSMKNAIDSPDFGNCLKCKNPIPIERILFRPESKLCVNCAI